MRKPTPARRIPGLVALAWAAFAVAIVVHGIPRGLPLSNDAMDFFVDPSRLLHEWAYSWNPNLFLGQETGTSQAFLPAALFYACLSYLHITGSAALQIYVCLVVLASFVSVLTLVRVLASRIGIPSSMAVVAGALYSLNLFVLTFVPSMASTLWVYALLPLAIAFAYKGIEDGKPLLWGTSIGCLTALESGANGAATSIAVLGWIAATLSFAFGARGRAPRLRSCVTLIAAAGSTALLLNAYWIIPLADQLPRVWLSGIFSEGAAWHSTAGSVFDELRFTNGYDLFGVDESGPYYAFGDGYRGVTLASVFSLLIPIAALAAFSSRRVRRLGFARFLLGLFLVAAAMGSGSYRGAWFGSLWLYAYYHVPFFQVFRSITKWDVIIALCLALALALAATEAARWLRSRVHLRRRSAIHILILAALAAQAVFLYPAILYGVVLSRQLVSVPSYWQSASRDLRLQTNSRVLIFPEAYVPKFFWGDVGSDFPEPYLDRPTDFLIANGTVAPSADSAVVTKAAYTGLQSSAAWTVPLLQRLSVSSVLDARDSYYYTFEQGRRDPRTTATQLRQIRGLDWAATDGLIDDYAVKAPLRMTRLANVLRSSITGGLLYSLFRLLGNDTSVQALSERDSVGQHRSPLLIGPGGILDAAVGATRPLGTQHAGSVSFYLGRYTDVDVFVRDRFDVRSPVPLNVDVDGRRFTAERAAYWTLVTSLLMQPGIHVAGVQGVGPLDIAAVDDTDLQKAEIALRRNGSLAHYFIDVSGGARFWMPPGTYDVRALVEPAAGPWGIPLRFARQAANLQLGVNAEIPVFLSRAVHNEALQPPLRDWYASPRLWPLAKNGRVNVESFGTLADAFIFNPGQSAAAVLVRGAFATLGGARSVAFLSGDRSEVGIGLAPTPDLNALLFQQHANPSPLLFSGPFASVDVHLVVHPGWSSVPVLASPALGFPDPESSHERPLLWESLGNVRAWIGNAGGRHRLRVSEIPSQSSPSGSGLVLRAGPTQSLIETIVIPLPPVSFDTLPSVRIPVRYSDGGSSLHAWTSYYENRVAHLAVAEVQETSPAEYDVTLRLGSAAPRSAKASSLVLVADVSADHVLSLSNPTLELQESASVRYQGPESPRLGNGNSLVIPRPPNMGLTRLAVPVTIPELDRGDVMLRAPKGYVIGVAIPLPVPNVSLVNASVEQLSFALPLPLSAAQRELWRRRVRLFYGAEEVAASRYREAVPSTFAVVGNTVVVDQPIEHTSGARWELVVIPDSWVLTNTTTPHTETLLVPFETGMTNLSGQTFSLPSSMGIAYLSNPAYSQSSAPIVGRPYYEVATGDATGAGVRRGAPLVRVDGNPIDLRWSRVGRWWAGTVALRGFVHEIDSRGPAAAFVLMMPGALPPPSRCRLETRYVSPVMIDVQLSARGCRGTIVNDQMFDVGWTASDNKGRTLRHVKVDGFANGFVLWPDTQEVFLRFSPQRFLVIARWVTIATIGAICIALVAVIPLRRFVQR